MAISYRNHDERPAVPVHVSERSHFLRGSNAILKRGVLGLTSDGYVGKRLKWQMRKVGICAQKLWMRAEQAPSALQPGWEAELGLSVGSVSQQQLENKGNRQNKIKPVYLIFWKNGLWPDKRGLGEKELNESWAKYIQKLWKMKKKRKGQEIPFSSTKIDEAEKQWKM